MERCNVEQHHSVCSLEPVCCEMREFGCSAVVPRKDLATHMRESELQHLTGMAVLNLRLTRQLQQDLAEKDKKIAQLQQEMAEQRQLQTEMRREMSEMRGEMQQVHATAQHTAVLTAGLCTPCEIIFDRYSHRKHSNKEFFSDPFYSHQHGYKFELHVKYYTGEHDVIGVFLCLLCGEYDDQLPWPVNVTVRLELLDQAGDHHHEETKSRTWRKSTRITKLPIDSCLMKYPDLEKRADGVQYMMNDCLKFRVHLSLRAE